MNKNVSMVEYVWIGGNNELRGKTKVVDKIITCVKELPDWNFDGSSTDQASGDDSEVILKPRRLFPDPFRGSNDKLVICDTYTPNGEPLSNNYRHWANKIFDEKIQEEPWFGLEQEYFIMDHDSNEPLGYKESKDQGQFYCSVGSGNAYGREVVETHLKYCIQAGIKISGVNAEVAPGQWEFQIGPCVGIEQGDHLWMARYILERVSELYGYCINYEPKPLKGKWNGSGCHANFSTKNMREGTYDNKGIDFIMDAIKALEKNHDLHMKYYGSNNEQRMTGEHETASFDNFSYGIANRGKSIRIGNENYQNEKGYFEDRRPSSNCDPYLVTGLIFQTTTMSD
jgi:glutamine synthetase